MVATVDIVNRALQKMGTRTTVTSSELTNQTSNEAIQANIALAPTRDELIRMAPWDCASTYNNLTLITATPGTPENPTQGTTTWQKGLPPPPWAYEYQYPVDCIRALFVIPQFNTGFASGIPITTAITGGSPAFWQGPPSKFKVVTDQFIPVTAAAVASGGVGYAIGDVVTLAGTPAGLNPIGAPVQLLVTAVGGGGSISTVSIVNVINGESPPVGGSYFAVQASPVAQGSTTGSGTGATFNLTFGSSSDQRVILTNQEFATLCYLKQVTDPNVMDMLFQEAWVAYLSSKMVISLTGDKALANLKVGEANELIIQARKADANEGLTVNDVTPDWIRGRGIAYATDYGWTPNLNFDWGPLLTLY